MKMKERKKTHHEQPWALVIDLSFGAFASAVLHPDDAATVFVEPAAIG